MWGAVKSCLVFRQPTMLVAVAQQGARGRGPWLLQQLLDGRAERCMGHDEDRWTGW